ncbi:MAG: PepSY-associated TM helix domain-containing protein [Nonlabens sp.]|uniref:PepSY-associated TM helix domain-containing protein n=1 Tax=Nonlabens sp. TaxID=1888209 RepID=UPI003EF44F49
MIKVTKDITRRLLDVHGWSGIILGLALYAVVLTGSIVVFAHEIGVWSISGNTSNNGISQGLDKRLAELSSQVLDEYLEEVVIQKNAADHLIVFFHQHAQNEQGQLRDKGVRFVLEPKQLKVVSKHEGFQESMPPITSSLLEQFFVDLHITLHAPDPIGLYLTGILGLVLLASAVSGVILHRHIILDMFLSPRRSNPLLNARDRHNLAGTWSIPFSIILAFTGAFFSFALTLGLPVIAMTAFGGDQQKAIETIIGEPAIVDASPQPFVGVDTIINQSSSSSLGGSNPSVIVVRNWGRADADVLATHEPAEGKLFGENHQFKGVSGEYIGEKPAIGKVSSISSSLINLIGALHFGTFSGILSRIIWLSLGLATCYVTLTGLQLWFKRREGSNSWKKLSLAIPTVGYGLPIAMAGSSFGFLFSFANHQTTNVNDFTVNGFLIGGGLSITLAFLIRSNIHLSKALQGLLGVSLILMPLFRMQFSGQYWLQEPGAINAIVLWLDIAFISLGCLMALSSLGILPNTPNRFFSDSDALLANQH